MLVREDCAVIAQADIAYIEEIPYCQNQRTAIRLAEAVGHWQERLDARDIKFRMIPVALWKSQALGKGNADKPTVKRIVKMLAGLGDEWPQDVYDACGIAMAGFALEKMAGVCASGGSSCKPCN